MRNIISKLQSYFEHRRNYKILRALIIKNSKDCDFDECFTSMAALNTFKKEGCMYHVDPSSNKPYKVYPEVTLSDKPSVRLKNEVVK